MCQPCLALPHWRPSAARPRPPVLPCWPHGGARRLTCGDLGLSRILARALGFGLLPRRVAMDGDLGLRSLGDQLPRHDDVIHLVSRADLPRTKGTRVLRDALMAQAASM